ncbi:MAG TPA: radical SAM family heme chaperone HemW [Methylomirabilota bacterium]|nr:radical SAM family heme chaperone HemW [Methylomirabilota bacterium]
MRGRGPRTNGDGPDTRLTAHPEPVFAGAGPGALAEAVPGSSRLGLYVHVPFCAERCPFCSFNTAPLAAGAVPRYLAALGRELELLAALAWAGDVRLATVFFGGGTPSLLTGDELAAVMARLAARLPLLPGAEVTVECNPESVTRETLAAYRAAGVNRLSLGVQALDDAVLARLGRRHTSAGARAAFEAARAAGFDNVSVDLMYGVPGLEVAAWTATVAAVLAWKPDHLSAYGLALDAGSVWGAAGVEGLPPEADVVAQYWVLAAAAARAGLEHYEISNYARPGFRSRHNETYWRAEEYLAAGPGACGFVGDFRYANVRAVPRYAAALEAGALPVDTGERLDRRQRLAERLFLGLRTSDGVPGAWLQERVAGDAALARRVDTWREAGLVVVTPERVRLTEAGFLVSDALFVELL